MKRLLALLVLVSMLVIVATGCGTSTQKSENKYKGDTKNAVWKKYNYKGKIDWNTDYKCVGCDFNKGEFEDNCEDEGDVSGQYKMTFNGPQCHTEVHILRHSINHDGVDEVKEIKDPPDEVTCWFDKNGESKYLNAGYDAGVFTADGREIFDELKSGNNVEVTFHIDRYTKDYDEYYVIKLKAANFAEVVNSY